MANGGLQLLGFILAFLGFIGFIASTSMVEWKMSSYAGDNIITAQALYEGLWKTCVFQSTGQMQCKAFDSLLLMPREVQGTRGLLVSAIFICVVAILVAMVGLKCTTCMEDNKEQKEKVALTGGIIFIIGGVVALAGTIWYGERIRQAFFDPFTPTNGRYEFGKALYIGWAASALTIIGGSFLCCNCGSKASGKPPTYPQSHASGQSSNSYV